MKKKILFIINFMPLPNSNSNSRFLYLLDLIDYNKFDVEVVTSDFYHYAKAKKDINTKEMSKLPYKMTLIDEPGYKKNVCLKRFYSHYKLGKNIEKYLEKLDYKPDIIYSSVPSLSVATAASKFANKNNIRFIVDVQDLWPEAFKMVFNIPIINNIIFMPMEKMANKIYSSADDIVAVSETYVERAAKVNNKYNNKLSVFLGTNLDDFDNIIKNSTFRYNDNYIRVAYIGTLGHSYDIISVIKSIKLIKDKGFENIKFLIMGDGPLKNSFMDYAKECGVDCEFTGNLVYSEMVERLVNCDIAVNPIQANSAASIINKVGDYAAAGLPVINTQESKEYKNLLMSYNAGYNVENGNFEQIADKIITLIKDNNLRLAMGKNNRRLAEDKFDRNKTYQKIIRMFEI